MILSVIHVVMGEVVMVLCCIFCAVDESLCNCVDSSLVCLCRRLICPSVQRQYVIAVITPVYDGTFP